MGKKNGTSNAENRMLTPSHTLQVSTLAWRPLMPRAALVWDSCGVLIVLIQSTT